MGKVNIYPNLIETLVDAQLFIREYMLNSNGKLKQSVIRHIPSVLVKALFKFGTDLGLKSELLAEHILWIHNNWTDYPKKCLTCDCKITDFESFNQQYKSDYCSLKCSNSNKKVQQYKKDTNIKKLGTEWGFQSDSVKAKSKETLILRYGVEHNMHDEQILSKNQRFRTKHYTLDTGTIVSYQGYEIIAILELLKTHNEDDLILQGIPTIWYNDRKNRYYPDIYVLSKNLMIEVKSTWTYSRDQEKNNLKKQACLDQGYNFEFWICSNKELLYIV